MGWVFALSGCSGADSAAEEDSDDEIVGRPPSQSEDPFEIMQTPAEARRAASSGYIGPEDGSQPDQSSGETDEETDGETEARAKEAEPDGDRPEERPGPTEVQCFSCVKLCPVDDGGETAACGSEERDVICGWGVHGERERAGELARAECNGALDMARGMEQWKRIDGECPPASCRSGPSRE